METHLTLHGWERANYQRMQNISNLSFLCIIRDPVERWISGITEYFLVEYVKKLNISISTIMDLLYDTNFIKMVFDGMTFDRHTQHQMYYIQNINLDNMIFFKLDNTLRSNLQQYFDSHGLENTFATSHVKKRPLTPIRQFFNDVLSTNDNYKKQVENWYNYELLTILPSICYYNNNEQ